MEQNIILCAKFIVELNSDGYYVDREVLEAARELLNDYVSENDCEIDSCDDEDDEDLY